MILYDSYFNLRRYLAIYKYVYYYYFLNLGSLGNPDSRANIMFQKKNKIRRKYILPNYLLITFHKFSAEHALIAKHNN